VKAKEIFEASGLESWCFRAPYAINTFSNLGKNRFYQVLHETGYNCSSSELKNSPPWKLINYKIPEFVIGGPRDDQIIDKSGIWDVKIIAKKFPAKVLKYLPGSPNYVEKTGEKDK